MPFEYAAMQGSMEDPSTRLRRASTAARRAKSLTSPSNTRSVLDDCVDEFTRCLRACVALPDDDEHFWNRVSAELGRLRARCQPQDAFAFELKAARVLVEYGFTTWPAGLMGAGLSTAAPQDASMPQPFAVDMQAGGRSAGTRAA